MLAAAIGFSAIQLGMVIIVPGVIALWLAIWAIDPVGFLSDGELFTNPECEGRTPTLAVALTGLAVVYIPHALVFQYMADKSWYAAIGIHSAFSAVCVAFTALWAATSPSWTERVPPVRQDTPNNAATP
ncbi:MAG: hypothetical protein GY913_19315 [Proteobacteria bacterium]|nr:hypothetical protein [Pseudomonadota bacterium]MCP4919060.1 hypothetical protein [Pseudomonadota bacterium]